MKVKRSDKRCGECIHYEACQSWNVGSLRSTDAQSCANYVTLRESTAYFVGYREGRACKNDE